MTTAFAAEPGHYVIVALQRKRIVETKLIPIVGWMNITGVTCTPLTAINWNAVTGYKAVLHPNGEVSDLMKLAVFKDTESWLAAVADNIPGPEETKPKPAPEPKAPLEIEPEIPPVGPDVKPSGEPPAEKPSAAEKPAKAPRKRTTTVAKPKVEPEAPAEAEDDDTSHLDLI